MRHATGLGIKHSRPRGFTLVEVLLAAVLLALVSGALATQLAVARQTATTARRTVQASMLGQALMDEIIRLPASSPGSAPPARAPSTFNVCGDFNGYADGPNNLCDIQGNPYPAAMQGFTRKVREQWITQSASVVNGANQNVPYAVPGDLITVTVACQGKTLFTLRRFVAALPQQP